jgi:hypothetical protein
VRSDIPIGSELAMLFQVEHSGFSTLNNQRFGAEFVGKLANPNDILLFSRARKANTGGGGGNDPKSCCSSLFVMPFVFVGCPLQLPQGPKMLVVLMHRYGRKSST